MTTATQARKPHIDAAFDDVAVNYDRLCSLNPGYSEHLRSSAERLGAPSGARLLDLACGTGLSTVALAEVYPDASITGLDVSSGMLTFACTKPELSGVLLLEGDATDPAAAGAIRPFDGILMAYGIRNLPDPDRCLANLHELLAPGATLCLHEYSVADSRWSRLRWNLVMTLLVMPLAWVMTGSTDIFRYLRRSVLEFDGVRDLERRLRRAGFVGVETLPHDGWQRGICHSFIARRALT